MKIQKIRFKNKLTDYPIIIGRNSINSLPFEIKKICPKTRNIAIFIDKNVPGKFKNIIKRKLKKYNLIFLPFSADEKSKSFKFVNYYLNKLLVKNFNRSDLVIAVGGGITGDLAGFVSSIFKRGINFINLPTTLLAQVDAAIGGKTGVNTAQGKNLVGSFYQPKLVISDTTFLDSLNKKEMICGYAEILKHAIIKDSKFFDWLRKYSKHIFSKNSEKLIYAIKKSCQIKIFFVNKDLNEKNLRMILNFGHTFAHAIEVKNNYSKGMTHGEAVLAGMILESRLSLIKKICDYHTVNKINKIYIQNNLTYTFKKFDKTKSILGLLPFVKNDKKNDDEKINFILLKKIGKTTSPNKFKISIKELIKVSKSIIQY